MEPTLDEASLVPCATTPPAQRIRRLAETLAALDRMGAPRVLRSVREAADRGLLDGHGLRRWCFDRQTPPDAGRLIAQRLAKAPFIDGADGLFAAAEGARAIVPTIGGVVSLGGGYVALTDSFLVILSGSMWPPTKPVVVHLEALTEEGERAEEVLVDAADCAEEVCAMADAIGRKVDAGVLSGATLVERISEICPHVVLGEMATEQIRKLTGSEPLFPQVLRHLRALDRAAGKWIAGTSFEPGGLLFSVESEATLKHGTFGPMRDFPTPPGFCSDRWTLHTKFSGGNGRLYFKSAEVEDSGPGIEAVRRLRVAVGYVGPHLRTPNFR